MCHYDLLYKEIQYWIFIKNIEVKNESISIQHTFRIVHSFAEDG